MTHAIPGIIVAATPFLAVAALFWLVGLIQARTWARVARQVALTDAIHRELGPVAAPTVGRRFGGRWRVTIAVPLDRPHTTAAIVRVIDVSWTDLAPRDAAPLEIMLLPRADTRLDKPAARRPASRPVPVRAAG
jgi:hypothetical protein